MGFSEEKFTALLSTSTHCSAQYTYKLTTEIYSFLDTGKSIVDPAANQKKNYKYEFVVTENFAAPTHTFEVGFEVFSGDTIVTSFK